MKKRRTKVPTIIGIIFLLLGLGLGLFFLQKRIDLKSKAAPDIAPQNVQISNILDKSFTVSWTTKTKITGSIDIPAINLIDGKSYTHNAQVENLNPSNTYSFKINGETWNTSTGPTLPPPSQSTIITGTVFTSAGNPASNSLIFIKIAGAASVSTITSESGNWAIPISTTRSQNLSSYYNFASNPLMEITVQAGPDGFSKAEIYYNSAKNVPAMVLGQIHDFKNITPEESLDSSAPEANIQSPTGGEDRTLSYFAVDDVIATPSAKTVTVESINEGEVISTKTPQFFGSAPKDTEIIITLESEVISDSVTADTSGKWKWSPTQTLTEGTHKLTLSWKDTAGISKTLTRNFVVAAAEGPAFVSTPSASLTPGPTLPPQPQSGISWPTVTILGISVSLILLAGSLFFLGI